jgi:hypothetical protein
MALPLSRQHRVALGGTIDRALDRRTNAGVVLSTNSIIERTENDVYVSIKTKLYKDKI